MQRLCLLLIALICCVTLATTNVNAENPRTTELGREDEVTVIQAEMLYTMDGEAVADGVVIVKGGKITDVGVGLAVPAGARVFKVPCLMPGLIDANASAGVAGVQAEQTFEVTPQIEVRHSIDWRSKEFLREAASGTTTLHIMPGSDNVFSGGTCVVKVGVGDNERLVLDHAGSAISICSDPASGNSSRSRPDSIYNRLPTNRMGVVWIIRSEFHEVLKVRSSQSPDENKNPKALTAAQQSLLRILDGEPLFSFTRTSFDLQTVLRLGEEYGIKPTIVGGEEAFRVLDSLAASKLPMIYTGMTTGTMTGNERTELHWNTPGKLEAAGITYCLGGGRLLEQAQFAVRFGASEQSALAAITTTPAAILNVEDRVGRIKVGMDADFVALSGQPLDFTSACLWTMADGKMIFTLIDTEPVASESESTR